MTTKAHKARAPRFLKIAVISVSSTRSLAQDKSGHWIAKRAKKLRHDVVVHQVVPDNEDTRYSLRAERGLALKT
jgi:molybdenum cofactor biosynthesis protein B